MITTFPDEETIVRSLSRAWWPVALVDDVERRPSEGHAATLLGRPLVVFRGESGDFYVADAQCPHRGASLALGHVAGEAVGCPYHGWQWDGSSGRCVRIPALGEDQSRIPPGAQLRTYPTATRWGIVWTCLDPESTEEVVDNPLLDGRHRTFATRITEQDTNLLFSMENFRDIAHFPFVHGNTFGAQFSTEVAPLDVESNGRETIMRLRVTLPDTGESVYMRGPGTSTYRAYAPGMVSSRLEFDGGGGFVLMHCVSPTSLEATRAFRVVAVSEELRDGLDALVALEDTVYAEDAVVAESITPRRLGMAFEQVHTLADAYTLAFRRSFLDWLTPSDALGAAAPSTDGATAHQG